MIERGNTKLEKVVVRFGDRMVKGYLESPVCNTIEDALNRGPADFPISFRVRPIDSASAEEIGLKDLKAIFYVNTFDGNSQHKNLNFYTRAPIVHGIWMRLQFLDGEVMEGIVHNSIRYLIDPGFFLLPTDPGSNNKLVYVVKSWLADLRILGLRQLP